MSKDNAYSVLGVRKGAAPGDIKKAYTELVRKFDPERHTDRFMVIEAAYDKLRHPVKRAAEDVLAYNHIPGRFLYSQDEQSEENDAQVNQHTRAAEEDYQQNSGNEETRKAYVQALMVRSFKKVQKRLWAEAIEDWRKVLEVEATHQRAKNNLLYSFLTLGYSYAEHELYDESIELWEKALQMDPENERLIHNLAIACEVSGKAEKGRRYWGKTLEIWQKRIEEDPEDQYTKQCIIEVRRHHGGQSSGGEEGRSPASIEEYREILKINPNDFEAHYKIATSLMEEQKWREASEELKALTRQYPKNIEVLNLLGWALINSGNIEPAFQIWNRSLNLDPKNYSTREAIVKGRMQMGRAFRNKGMHTQALVHFKALMRFTPNNPEVQMEIGRTYMLKGDKRSAGQAFRQVLKLDPKNKEAKQNLSDMKLRL